MRHAGLPVLGRRLCAVLLCAQVGLAMAAPPTLKIFAQSSLVSSTQMADPPRLLSVEVAREVQRRVGNADPIEVVPWARAIALASKEANVVLLPVIRTPERDRFLTYAGPVFQLRFSAFALRSRAAELRASDPGLRSLRGGARRGGVFAQLARDAGYTVTDEVNNIDTALRMLRAGRYDLLFDSDEMVAIVMRQSGYEPDWLENMASLGSLNAYFAFSKGTPDAVVRAWDDALSAMRRDGSLQKIYQRWLPGFMPPDAVAVPLKRPH